MLKRLQAKAEIELQQKVETALKCHQAKLDKLVEQINDIKIKQVPIAINRRILLVLSCE